MSETALGDTVKSMETIIDQSLRVWYLINGSPYGRTEAGFQRWCDELERFIDETEGNLE